MKFLMVFMTVIAFSSQSQSVSTLMGARAAGMGFASALLSDGASILNNVGTMAGNSSSTFFAYDLRQQMPGANRMAAAVQLPFAGGMAGFSTFRFGDDVYSEQLAGVGFSNQFGETSLGIKLNYIQYRAEAFGVKHAFGLDFGGRTQITPQISVGAYIINLNQPEISPGEKLPTRLVAGLGFKLDESFLAVTEVDKDLQYPATWKTGFEYTIHKKIFVRSGFNLNPSSFHCGLGAHISNLKIDYALQFNTLIGLSHQASAVVQLGKSEKK